MRIGWVTPFSRRSAIGRVSASVTRMLKARGHEIRIIRSERRIDVSPIHSTQLNVEWWRDVPPSEIANWSDVVIVNFGDHYGFHAGTLSYVDALPCLGIFHDFFLYYFFNGWIWEEGLGEARHQHEVRATYGERATAIGLKAWRDWAPLEEIVEAIPMTEWLARRCGAVLTHSRFCIPRLEASCPGPIAVAPLCFEPRPVEALPIRNNEEVVIATIGHMNQNKCAEWVIRAIAASPVLRRRCRYRLVGRITFKERARLATLCHDIGFERVDILGELPEAGLIAELERTDILACLRKPILEAASASAIEGMKAGRPVIVADAGFYADLPDDLVFKIPASIEVQPLTAVLERLVSQEKLRRDVGTKARTWAMRTFTTEAYVNVLEDLIVQFINARPLLAVSEKFGGQLAALGASQDNPSIERIADVMHGLFGNSK